MTASQMIPKVWFFTYNVGAVFFLPYINLFYRHLGFSEAQIGILCALKPWVSAPAGNLIVSLADSWRAHFKVAIVTYLVCLFGRGLIALVTSYGIQAVLALLTESCAAPMGIIVDAAVMAAATDEGGYGRQRMWASVGWGGMSPVAGAVVASFGLPAAFGIYFIICLLAFIPTCMLPISALSAAKLSESTPETHGSKEGEDPTKFNMETFDEKNSIELSPLAKNQSVDMDDSWTLATATSVPATPEDMNFAIFSPIAVNSRTATEQIAEMADGQTRDKNEKCNICDNVRGGEHAKLLMSPLLCSMQTKGGTAPSNSTKATLAGVAEGSEHGSIMQGIMQLLKDAKVVTFFFLAFCMGIGNGCIGYLFLYLDELGGSGTLMGLCLTFNCLAEVPILFFSGKIFERLGVERSFHLAMIGYILRLCGYIILPYLPNVWWVLPIEMLQGLTFALAWSSGCVYVKRIAPVWLRSTVQSIFSGLYTGIGQGLGGLMGGFMYGAFGADIVFKTAAVTLLAGFIGAQIISKIAAKHNSQRYRGYTHIMMQGSPEQNMS